MEPALVPVLSQDKTYKIGIEQQRAALHKTPTCQKPAPHESFHKNDRLPTRLYQFNASTIVPFMQLR